MTASYKKADKNWTGDRIRNARICSTHYIFGRVSVYYGYTGITGLWEFYYLKQALLAGLFLSCLLFITLYFI